MIFGLIPISMLVPFWIVLKFWSREDEDAELELYDDYAILKMKNEKIKNENSSWQDTLRHFILM